MAESDGAAAIDRIPAAAIRIPTDRPEADAALARDLDAAHHISGEASA